MTDNRSAYNAAIYDGHIINVLPYYHEFHKQIIDLVRATGRKEIDWLDTGCGTGSLAAKVLETREDVRFTLCDPSEPMLNEAKEKLNGKAIRFFHMSSQDLSFDAEFDVVTAVQGHHYLHPEEREDAVRKCHRALRESGIFVAFENIRLSTDESDAIGLERWLHFLREHGEAAEMHRERRNTTVFPITIEQHLDLLQRCGFRSADVLWTSFLQAGFWAIK